MSRRPKGPSTRTIAIAISAGYRVRSRAVIERDGDVELSDGIRCTNLIQIPTTFSIEATASRPHGRWKSNAVGDRRKESLRKRDASSSSSGRPRAQSQYNDSVIDDADGAKGFGIYTAVRPGRYRPAGDGAERRAEKSPAHARLSRVLI